MSIAYFWKEGVVVPFVGYAYVDAVRKEGLESLYCLDTNEHAPAQRYGMFDPVECWVHVPLEQFPKEFLTNLLLLGVPI